MPKKKSPPRASHVRPIEAWGLRLPVETNPVGKPGAQLYQASVTYGELTIKTAAFGNVDDAVAHLTKTVKADADQALQREIERAKLRAWNAGLPRQVGT